MKCGVEVSNEMYVVYIPYILTWLIFILSIIALSHSYIRRNLVSNIEGQVLRQQEDIRFPSSSIGS